MHSLQVFLVEQIVSGLQRKAITTASRWAEKYRIMGQPFPGVWTFDHHPWLKEMHDNDAEIIIGQKAAQMGFTEAALNKVFKAIDIDGTSVLYVLPASTPDAGDFSTSRFDSALEMSEHLQNMFTDVKNIGHKRAGNANLYIRGSRSRSQLKSIPVGLVIVDEKDEMVQENVPMIFERMSGQLSKQIFQISTPTIENYGINADYKNSSQRIYHFKCPSCGKWTYFEYPSCLVITTEEITDQKINNSYLICRECKNILKHEDKRSFLSLKNAKWIPSYSDREVEGYHINQLYSMTVKPSDIAKSVLRSRTNPADEQELYNSKLGITHTVEGARITDKEILACTGSFQKSIIGSPNLLLTMGVDVGKWLHFEIDQWFFNQEDLSSDLNLVATCKLINEGKVLDFEKLDELMRRFLISYCVIDANPEKRKALEFAQRWPGHIKLCYYGNSLGNTKQINVHREDEAAITVDRTSWLDMSFSRFHSKRIQLPLNLSQEYKQQIKTPVRIYEKDRDGNPIGRYVTTQNDADHFAHARNYAEIALPLAASLAVNYNIGRIL
jgi:hypothetical protein